MDLVLALTGGVHAPAPGQGALPGFIVLSPVVWLGTLFASEFPYQEVEHFPKSWFAVWVESEFPEARSLLVPARILVALLLPWLHGKSHLFISSSQASAPRGAEGGQQPQPILVPLCTEVPLCGTP